MKPRRVGKGAGVERAKAGVMASSHGTATAAPRPRSRVRREMGCMLIVLQSPLILYVLPTPKSERIAFYNFDHHAREPVLVLRDGGQRLVERPVVVRLHAAPQGVDHHLLDHAAGELVLLGQDR